MPSALTFHPAHEINAGLSPCLPLLLTPLGFQALETLGRGLALGR